MDTQIREILEKLGDALFPVDKWIATRKKDADKAKVPYCIPFLEPTPWRDECNPKLSMKTMRTMDFVETLLESPESSDQLVDRWNYLVKNPLKHSPHDDPDKWRRDRGLASEARFGIFEARNNWPADGSVFDGEGNAVSRKTFYESYMPVLQSLSEILNEDQEHWEGVAEMLVNDNYGDWPSKDLKSSVFIKQYRRDLIVAMMGMQDQSPVEETARYQRALLIELGEHRRVGDAHTRKKISEATAKFAKMLNGHYSAKKSTAKAKMGKPRS